MPFLSNSRSRKGAVIEKQAPENSLSNIDKHEVLAKKLLFFETPDSCPKDHRHSLGLKKKILLNHYTVLVVSILRIWLNSYKFF